MCHRPSTHTVRWKMTENGLGHVLWVCTGALLSAAVFVTGDLPSPLARLQPQGRAIDTHTYYSYNKIAHKACRVGGVEGVCMFVWECIKTDGNHMGMCMDGFMFGSCCSHDEASNSLKPSSGQKEAEEVAPGITVRNTTEPVTPTIPTPTATTGAASVITSRPLTIQRPTSHPLTQRPAPSAAPPVTSAPPVSSPSSMEPPSTPASPVPPTPPSPPTRPTRPPKPTK